MASSRRHPPQLSLAFSTPPHQSFKRSFQQFGLDVDSPQSAGGSSSSSSSGGGYGSNVASSSNSSAGDGNERNKRARSESSSVEFGETSGSSSGVEVERYRPMIPEFIEDTMDGIEVGSSQASSSSSPASGSTSANASTLNNSMNSSFESSLFSSQTFEEHRGPVVEPAGVPVAAQSLFSLPRRRLFGTTSFRASSMQRDRPTLPGFDDVNRPSSLHPALRARPSSPVMTAPTTHGTTSTVRSGPSAPPTANTIESLNAAIDRARAFDASMEPLRRTSIDLTPYMLPISPRTQQSALPRPRMRELHPDQLARFGGGGGDSDGEDVDLPPVSNEYSGRERLPSVGNPAIRTLPTSPNVELNAFSVGPLESASRPGPGTASSLLRSRLETASRHAEQGGPSGRRLPRLQTRDQLYGTQSSQAPALYPSSTWSQENHVQEAREPVGPGLSALHNQVNTLIGEMNSPVRLEDQQGMDMPVPRAEIYERQYQPPPQASGAEPIFRNDGTQRPMRRRPRTLLNRSSSPPRSMPSRQYEPAATLRRLLSNDRAPPPQPEPRFDSIFAPGDIQRERVLPAPIMNSGRASARPVFSAAAEPERDRSSRYYAELAGADDRGTIRNRAPLHFPPAEVRSASRTTRRPGLLNPSREDAPSRNLPDLFSVYNDSEAVEREADQLARLSSTLPGIRTSVDPYSPTYEEDATQWGRAIRADNHTSAEGIRRARSSANSYAVEVREREAPRREERDMLPRPITALTNMREQDRMFGFESAPTSPFETPNPWEQQPPSGRPMVPDFSFDTSSSRSVVLPTRPVSDSFSSAHTNRSQTDSVLRERRLRLMATMTEATGSSMTRMAASPQEDTFHQSWAESAMSYDAEPSLSVPSTSSFSRSEEQPSMSFTVHRPSRLMGPRRSSGGEQSSGQIPRLPENEQEYSGWLPAPRPPTTTTRQVEVAPSELSTFYNDPSFDIPPSPPQEPAWRTRIWSDDHFASQSRSDELRQSASTSHHQQYQQQQQAPQNETVPEPRSDEAFANLLFGGSERASDRERERNHQVHRFLSRRVPPVSRPVTRREPSTTAVPSSSYRGDATTGQSAAANRTESVFTTVSNFAPPFVSTNDFSARERDLWGIIDGQEPDHTLSGWGQTLRRRQRASLNQPMPSIDAFGSRRETNAPMGLNMPGMLSARLANSSSSNATSAIAAAAARRQNARRPRLPSIQMTTRSPFTDEPLSTLRTIRRTAQRRGIRNFGDYVRDEDFDSSYEGLLALGVTLGEVKPRSTPSHIIDALPTGTFQEWRKKDSDARCPICLDDYADTDAVLRCEPCAHWCHKECLQQWLHTARTCPVCRGKVHPAGCPPSPAIAGPSNLNSSSNSNNNNNNSDDDDSSDDEPSWGSPRIPPEMYRLLASGNAGAYYR